jgi:predicted homoserine dehydrogenase-like protein
VRTDNETVHEELHYLKLGEGPYFALYRPYHLASIEAPLSIGEAVLDRTASLQPVAWLSEVFAAAKRDLAPDEVIDGIGATTIYGMASSASDPDAGEYVPLGLLWGARLVRPVAVDELIRWDDVEIDPTSTLMVLRGIQDQLLDGRLDDEELLEAVGKALP